MPDDAPDQPGNAPLVLAVDDEAGNRELLTRHLSRHHYDVMTFADGESALAYLESPSGSPT